MTPRVVAKAPYRLVTGVWGPAVKTPEDDRDHFRLHGADVSYSEGAGDRRRDFGPVRIWINRLKQCLSPSGCFAETLHVTLSCATLGS